MSHEDPEPRRRPRQAAAPPGLAWEQVESATIHCAEAFAVRWTGRSQPWGHDVLQLEYASGADHIWLHALSADEDSIESEDAIADEITSKNCGVQMTLPDLVALHRMIGGIIANLPAVHHQGEGSALIQAPS
jgi:hypothetical protein